MTSLRHKLWLSFGGLLAILLIVSGLASVVLTSYSHTLDQLFRENYDSAVYCNAMSDALDRLNTRAQFITWGVQPVSHIDAASEEQTFDHNLTLQLGNCTLPGELDHTNDMLRLWQEYKQEYHRIDTDTAATAGPALYRNSLLPLSQLLKQDSQWIAGANIANMVWVDRQAKRTLQDVREALLFLVIFGAAAAALLLGAAGAGIIRPLHALTRSARDIEGGNLDLILPVRSQDEVGQLAEAFNAMAAKLREFRRLDHDRLVRTQQTTQLAIDSLPDAVFIIGPDGRIEISNRTARQHFGIEPDATLAALTPKLNWLAPLVQSARDGDHPEEPQGYRSAIQLFVAGHERFLLPRAVSMLGPDDRPIGVICILVDVTRLRAADELKSGLVSTVSHELRTPLTTIRMALSLLIGRKFGDLTAKQNSLISVAREDSDRLYRIVENILSMSRIESGKAPFHLDPMKPADIVNQAAEPLRSAIAEKQIALILDLAPDLPAVQADAAAIGSAMTNLLGNAVKFTPAQGRIEISARAAGEFVEFSVADSGPGIAPEYAARIFDKFFRVPRKEGPTGAGLGLAIAKEIIEAHGGQIELYSPPIIGPTAGAIFRFTLPIHPTLPTVDNEKISAVGTASIP